MELALALPIVMVVIAAVVEITLVASDQLRLWHAAREAARVAVVDPDPKAADRMVTDQGFSSADVNVIPPPAERRGGEPLTVSVAYPRPSRIPVIGSVIDGLELRARATMRIEQP
ncbi:MAG: TadE/TadG family type IV pilus assembly protein [Actinomycetota bacterium]